MRYSVPGMNCGHCKASVEKAIAGADRGAVVAVDLRARTVDVTSVRSDAELLGALREAGYDATPL